MKQDSMDQALSRLYDTQRPPESFETGWRAAVRREESLQMNTRKPAFIPWGKIVPVLAVLVLVLGGLGTGMLEDRLNAPQRPASNTLMMSRSSSASYKEEAAYDMAVGSAYSLASADNGISTYGGTQMAVEETRKLVRNASMTLRTQRFDEALASVETLVSSVGGYVENLYQYGESTRHLNLGLRIPSEKLDEFLLGVSGVGRVTDRSESTTDMTVQYADNAARLETLYAKRDRLNELLAQASAVSDLIEIESAIADTQYQIDSYETTQRSIDRQVDMSTVSLTLAEETSSDTANADVSLGERISAALSASLEWTGEFLLDMLVFVVMVLPIAVPVAVIVLVVWLIRRKNKKEK